MFKKIANNIIYIIIGIILASVGVALAVNITVPQAIHKGDVLVGNTNHTYSPVATSTLGIISGGTASGTPGLIQFAGAGGAFNSNANLVWDNSAQTLNGGTVKFNNTDFNTQLGFQAGLNQVVGSATDNTFVGYKAGLGTAATMTASNNVAVGDFTFNKLTTGQNNVAVGSAALFGVTTGSFNFGLGANALGNVTTGSNNTAIGDTTMFQVVTGSNNTVIGNLAGANLNDPSSGNLMLGSFAGAYETGSNSFYVDNKDETSNVKDRTGALFYGTFSPTSSFQTLTLNASTSIAQNLKVYGAGNNYFAGNVGIGTTTPTQALTVVGNERLTGALFDTSNASGTSGQILSSTGTGTAWTTASGGSTFFATVCASGCTYTATGTNDQVGINAAITAANSAGGGTVLIKAGSYHNTATSGQIKMRDISNVTLMGEGDGTKLFIGGGLGIEVASSTNIHIKDLFIDGSGQSHGTFNADQAVQINNSHNVKFESNTIVNSWGFGMFIINNGLPNITNSSTSDITVLNNYLNCQGNQDCIGGGKSHTGDGSINTADVSIIGNTIIQNSFAGGVLNSSMDTNCIDMVAVYRENFSENNCKGGVIFGNEKYPNTYSKITNNIVDSPLGPVLVSGEIAMEMGCDDCTVTTNATGTPAGDLITGNIIKNGGIYITGTSQNPYNHLLISNNTIQTATSSAQHFRSAEHGIQANQMINSTITGNNITAFSSGQATDGIFFQASTNNIVTNNHIRDFATGLDMTSANTEMLNTFANVTTRIINPGTFIDSNGGNLTVSNNGSFNLSYASSTAIVSQPLAQLNSSNDFYFLPNIGDATHPVNSLNFGYNSPIAWTMGGGSCCGGAMMLSFNSNTQNGNAFQVNGTSKVTVTSAGLNVPSGSLNITGLSATQLVGTDASKNLNSITLGTNLSFSGTTLNATGGGSSISTSTALTAGQVLFSTAANTIGNDSNFLWDNSTKKLGIGRSPGVSLDIQTGSNTWERLTRNSSSNDVAVQFETVGAYSPSQPQWNFGVPNGANKFAIYSYDGTTLSTRMVIDTSGNVGIGTSTPSTKLYLQNAAGSTAIFAMASSTNAIMTQFDSDGHLGIGTTTDTSNLAVQGKAGQTNNLFNISSSSGVSIYKITSNGHYSTAGASPVLSTCGTTPSITGNDVAGTVTGGTGATGCVITFVVPYINRPSCQIGNESGVALTYSVTNTAITVVSATLGTGKIDYTCMGLNE